MIHNVKGQRGFSLIELMIVVAIVGIIAAIAYPSYGQYVTKSRRSDGHLALLNASQAMERCKASKYSYATCTLSTTSSEEGYYTLSLNPAATATTFTIEAKATGVQSSDSSCSPLKLTHTGVKSPADCW